MRNIALTETKLSYMLWECQPEFIVDGNSKIACLPVAKHLCAFTQIL